MCVCMSKIIETLFFQKSFYSFSFSQNSFDNSENKKNDFKILYYSKKTNE